MRQRWRQDEAALATPSSRPAGFPTRPSGPMRQAWIRRGTMSSDVAEAAGGRSWAHDMTARVRHGNLRDYGIVVVFLALFITFSVSSSTFLERQNFANILDQYAALG